jgi:CDP-6-deoxy-D-xylo-4-hexulose-3-dehydrase
MHPLASSTWGGEEIQAINEVVASGNFTMGAKTSEYERAFASYIGTKYALACNSGSSANLLMVAAYTLRYGKELSSFQRWLGQRPTRLFSSTAGAWFSWTLTGTLLITTRRPFGKWSSLRNVVILAVNLLGNPNDFNEFPKKRHILEDNCESLGAEYAGKKTGCFG